MPDKVSDILIRGKDYLARIPDFQLVGRDDLLSRLIGILMRKKANSVLMVGPGGVGCSAICMGLEASKEADNAPFDIVDKRLFWLNTDGLFASGNQEQINASFQKMMSALIRTPESVLIIPDAKDFIEGSRNAGCSHFINGLNLAVRNEKTQAIIETRDDDLDMVLKCHSDMREGYTLLDVDEPAEDDLIVILTNRAKSLEKHHRIKIAPDAIKVAADLTNKYRTKDAGLSRAQPERSITLLDRALTSYRLASHSGQYEQPESRRIQEELNRLSGLTRDGEASIRQYEDEISVQKEREEERRKEIDHADSGHADPVRQIGAFAKLASQSGFESQEIQVVRKKILEMEAAIKQNTDNFNTLLEKLNASLLLTKELVTEEFSRISGYPVDKLNQNDRQKLMGLEASLEARVYDQPEPIKRLTDAIISARIRKIKKQNKPMASFMFMGPSGVGKTELCLALAVAWMGDENALLRFDMSDYMEKHAVAKMIGAPPGYEGFEAGGILTNAMRKNPSRILLFDEIEKAHPDVFNIFLQILSAGRLADNVGRVVSFETAVILMTTNIGQKYFLDQNMSFEDAKKQANIELNETYRAELLNRFQGRQNIICFNRLQLSTMERIVRREINNLNLAYGGPDGLSVHIPDTDLTAFCHDYYDPAIGARGLPGIIEARIEPEMSKALLENPDVKGQIEVRYDSATKALEVVHPEAISKAA